MSKARLVMEIVTLLQGTPVDDFARQNLFADGNKVVVKCALNTTTASPAGNLQAQHRHRPAPVLLSLHRRAAGSVG